jgi:hypothetical protein
MNKGNDRQGEGYSLFPWECRRFEQKKPAQIRFHSNSLESVGQRPLPLGQRKRN